MANNRELSQFANVVGYNGGNIGIATANPTERLHLIGGSSSSAGTQVDIMRLVASDFSPTNSGGLTIGAVWHNTDVSRRISYLQSSQNLNSGSTNRALCLNPNGGLIGIGTDDPNRLLHLKAASSTAYSGGSDSADYNFLKIENTTDDKSAGVFFLIGSNGEAAITATEVSDGATDIAFQNRGGGVRSEKVRLDSGGRLMVGRSASDSSDSLLIVQGNAGDSGTGGQMSIQRGGNANPTAPSDLGSLIFKDSAASRGAVIGAVCDGDWASNDYPTRLEFKVTADGASSPTERMRITSAGLMGLGTSSPQSYIGGGENLVIAGSGDAGMTIATGTSNSGTINFADGTSGDARYRGRIEYSHSLEAFDFLTSATTRMRITSVTNGAAFRFNCTSQPSTSVSGSSVLPNGPSGNYYLSYSGHNNAFNHAEFGNGNGVVGYIQTNGSSTSYNTSSDYRLKENVVDLNGAITRVKQLAPKRFNFIADDSRTVDGFLAHEAQTVVPEAVTGTHNEVDDDNNPVYQGIDQSKLVPLLTAALQEAVSKIETLETQHADLLARVTTLEGS